MDIANIDQAITKQISLLKPIITNARFKTICTFRITDEQDNIEKILNEVIYPGIYLIEIKTNKSGSFADWAKDFKKLWDNEKYKGKWTPTTKKKRIIEHKALNGWVPIYIGKSKSINKRIFEHIYLGLDKKTSALKLSSRQDLRNKEFRLRAIKVEVNNYDVISTEFEKTLRDKINPITGKQ